MIKYLIASIIVYQAMTVCPTYADDLSEKFSHLANSEVLSDDIQDVEVGRSVKMLADHGVIIPENEMFLVIDRNPKKQILTIIRHNNQDDYEIIGMSHVSTGKPGRKEHFETPTGVFDVTGDILGYRALGTFNANHIRGNGLKGMRVWDFGWQDTKDWRSPTHTTQIRMEMHATDPANLEHRIGRPDSEGCIRIHADVNEFIDTMGVLDKTTNQLAQEDSRSWKYLLGKKHEYRNDAGQYLVIIDSGEK